MSEPTIYQSLPMSQYFAAVAPHSQLNTFVVVWNGTVHVYAFADKAAAKTYWAAQSGFVSWYDAASGVSFANTSTSGGGGGAAATRPTNAFLNSVGTLRGYYPMDRLVGILNGGAQASLLAVLPTPINIGNAQLFGSAGSTSGAAVLTPVVGHYDGAFQGSRRLEEAGGAVAGAYPTAGQFTVTRCAWFKELDPGAVTCDLFNNLLGGNNQFLLLLAAGAINCIGYSALNGYLFPENEGPPYVKRVGTFPNDGAWHHIGFVLTNDADGVVAASLKIYVDGVLTGTFAGRAGAYYGAANAQYSYMGGNSATAGAQRMCISDLGIWDGDASALIPTLAA